MKNMTSTLQDTSEGNGRSSLWTRWSLRLWSRSIVTDPRKAERKALRELRKLSRAALPSDREKLKRLHIRWRDAASRYFNLNALEPTPTEVFECAKALRNEQFAQNWKQAWVLSDQFLFGVKEVDSSEWKRLQSLAVGMCPGKNYSPSLAFRARAWLPTIAFALLALGVADPSAAQDETAATPADLYQEGSFKAAAEKWEAAVNAEPNAFEHRYNAGLALAQTGDWPRAWAYWTSAFCLDPNRDEVAWNLRIAHQNTTAYDPVLQSLIEGEGLYRIVRLRSPAQWQALSLQAVWALGIVFFLAILALYLGRARRLSGYLLALALLCGIFAYFSQWAHLKYERLGEPDSILVVAESPLLTIPTDLQSEQVSTTVGEGTIVKKQRTFLGWVKIELPNGESGWLRQENLMPLYGKPTQS